MKSKKKKYYSSPTFIIISLIRFSPRESVWKPRVKKDVKRVIHEKSCFKSRAHFSVNVALTRKISFKDQPRSFERNALCRTMVQLPSTLDIVKRRTQDARESTSSPFLWQKPKKKKKKKKKNKWKKKKI